MGEELKVKRPIDQAAHESYNWFNKSYVYIKKTKMQTWQSIFILAFVTGAVAAIIFTVSTGWHSASQAAPRVKAPNDACAVSPAGGSFTSAVNIAIKCGSLVKEASYQWDLGTVQKITARKGKLEAKTIYPADKYMWLTVSGYTAVGEFSKVYAFRNPNVCARVITGDSIFHLEPCNIQTEMTDTQGDKDFTFTLVRETGDGAYGFSVYGYGEGFPTYAILGGASSGGATANVVFNKYFNDNVLHAEGDQPRVFNGYLPIMVYLGSASADNQEELHLALNLTILPGPQGEPCTETDNGMDFMSKGITTGLDGVFGNATEMNSIEDKCMDNRWLDEFYCSYDNDPSGGLGFIDMQSTVCDFGCFEGACLPKPVAEHYFIEINCSVYGCDVGGLNEDDVMVAWSIGSNKITTPDNPSDGVFDLMFPGATNMQVNNINNNGEIVGSYDIRAGALHGFKYFQSNYTAIDKPGATHTEVIDINDSGTMLISTDRGADYYLYDGQTYTLIDISHLTDGYNVGFSAINNHGHLLGSFTSNQASSFIYDGTKLTIIEYPNALRTIATGFNDNGQVVGTYNDSYTEYNFIFDGNTIKRFLHPALSDQGIGYSLRDINNKGHVVGSYSWYGPSGTTKFSFLAIPLGQPTPPSPIPELTNIVNSMADEVLLNGTRRIGQYKFLFKNESVDKAQLKDLRLHIEVSEGVNIGNITAYLLENPQIKTIPTIATSTGEPYNISYYAYLDLSPLQRTENSSSEAELVITTDITGVSTNDWLQTTIYNVNESFNYMTKYGLRYPDMPWNTNIEGGGLSN